MDDGIENVAVSRVTVEPFVTVTIKLVIGT